MRNLLRLIFLLIMFLPVMACAKSSQETSKATAASDFQEGRDYALVNPDANRINMPSIGGIHVQEFFNYACPACNRFEPTLEQWLATKPKDIGFERIPVVFQPGWEIYAKAYYTAKTLGLAEKITPAVFKAIHEQGVDLSNQEAWAKFLASEGVSKRDFESAFNFSPGIDAQLLRGENLMRSYAIVEVPTLVINGKYKVNPGMVNGDSNRMIAVVNFLVDQERHAQKAH